MTINEIIQKRRTVYPSSYSKKSIDNLIITQILENANMAPSHRLTQPWFFKIYKGNSKEKLAMEMVDANKKSLESLNYIDAKSKKIIDKCKNSDCVIAVFMKRDPKKSVPMWEEIASTAMAVQNMWLSCVYYKIGCYWSTPKFKKFMKKYFKLKNNEKCLGFFYMGKYDHNNIESKKRISIKNKTKWYY